MIHSRKPSPPTLIQHLPTGAAPPPTATRLHGVGSPREGLDATTPQHSTPTVSPYWTVLGGQVVIRAQPTSTGLLQTTASQADRRRQQHQEKERGNLARPPQGSNRQEPGQSTFQRHRILIQGRSSGARVPPEPSPQMTKSNRKFPGPRGPRSRPPRKYPMCTSSARNSNRFKNSCEQQYPMGPPSDSKTKQSAGSDHAGSGSPSHECRGLDCRTSKARSHSQPPRLPALPQGLHTGTPPG